MNQKKAKEIADDLGKLFQQIEDALEIDEFYAHFHTELRIIKQWRKHNHPGALPDEKIAALEKAVEEFDATYQAELAEAKKMPISWHEARRVLKLFKDAQDRFISFDTTRIEQ